MNKLHWARKLHQLLYNAAVYNRKTQYQKFGYSVDYFEQQNCLPEFKEVWPEYKELNSMTLQATLKRVDFAFQRFFQGLGKYPKFKPIRHFSGWTYPDARQGFKVQSEGKNGYLNLRDLGLEIQMRGQARTWPRPVPEFDSGTKAGGCLPQGRVTTCTIVYRNQKWFASVTVNCLPQRTAGKGATGIDLGCEKAATLSDGTKVDNPRFLGKALDEVRQKSKQLRRKKKGSRRWKKHQRQLSKLKRKVANRRQNWVHQTAAEITKNNSLVATEKLNVKNMTTKAKQGQRKQQKAGLNRSVLDVGFGALRWAIEDKLKEAGGVFIEVPTRHVKPSQTCPNCGQQKKKDLSERTHRCACGCVLDRDHAAAQVMLRWALGTSVLDVAEGDHPSECRNRIPALRRVADGSSSTDCGSMKQLAQRKRQKHQAKSVGELETPPLFSAG